MKRADAYTRISAILSADFQVPAERVVEDAHLRADLGLDSLALTDLAFLLQSDFGFKSEPDEFRGVATVGALVDFVADHAP